jgi:hypothetical protein
MYTRINLLLFLISISFVGCLGDYNRFVDIVERNDNLKNNYTMKETYIEKYNTHIRDIMYRPEYYGKASDLDYSIVEAEIIDSKNIKYTYSFNESFIGSKYVDYYFIVDRDTSEIVDWEFTYCNKREIDANDEKSYQTCLRDSRVTKEEEDVYRIGVNRAILERYGYKKTDYKTRSEDDIKIVTDVLDADGLCKNGIEKILKKEYWGFEHNVRYYVKCKGF